jgi:electron transfer flavoprotein alpha subunit
MSAILVYVETKDDQPKKASLEALGAASRLGGEVVALLYGRHAQAAAAKLAGSGAAKALAVEDAQRAHFSPEAVVAALAAAAAKLSPRAIFFAATSQGRDLAPRLAEKLGCAQASDCTELRSSGDGKVEARRPVLAGKAYTWMRAKNATLVATLRPNVFAEAKSGGAPAVESMPAPAADLKSIVKEIVASASGKLDVSEAPVVVSGGRGLKEAGNWKVLEDLAAAFGGRAALGASRAVVDAGWRPHAEQVGQTGKTVAPQLYFAVGISGAIQHLAGMRTAKTIVAINKDPEAPIFKVADYGIVGDALEVVPALTAAIKKAIG